MVKGDITQLEVDAIVNAANSSLLVEVVLMEPFIRLEVNKFCPNAGRLEVAMWVKLL